MRFDEAGWFLVGEVREDLQHYKLFHMFLDKEYQSRFTSDWSDKPSVGESVETRRLATGLAADLASWCCSMRHMYMYLWAVSISHGPTDYCISGPYLIFRRHSGEWSRGVSPMVAGCMTLAETCGENARRLRDHVPGIPGNSRDPWPRRFAILCEFQPDPSESTPSTLHRPQPIPPHPRLVASSSIRALSQFQSSHTI
jgi:hypothetical protein